jgi:hypothetical protein
MNIGDLKKILDLVFNKPALLRRSQTFYKRNYFIRPENHIDLVGSGIKMVPMACPVFGDVQLSDILLIELFIPAKRNGAMPHL